MLTVSIIFSQETLKQYEFFKKILGDELMDLKDISSDVLKDSMFGERMSYIRAWLKEYFIARINLLMCPAVTMFLGTDLDNLDVKFYKLPEVKNFLNTLATDFSDFQIIC